MQLRFEQFVATSMLGSKDAAPRRNGELLFSESWQRCAFGIAVALSKKGHYEWEDFRQQLITSISEWESEHALDDPSWNYYERWLIALERTVVESKIVESAELETRTAELMTHKRDEVF